MEEMKDRDHEVKESLHLWKKLLPYIGAFKKELVMLGGIMVGVAVIEAAFPYMTKIAIDEFVLPQKTDQILGFSIAYGLLVIIQALNIWFLIAIAGNIETGVNYGIRKAGFKRLQELSISYYDNKAVGWLMARITSDVGKLGEIISWGLVDLVWGITKMVAIMGIMLFLNWKLALVTLFVIPVIAVASVYFQKKMLKAYRQVRKINSRITGAFNEVITGAKTTKVLVREEKNLEEFSQITSEMRISSIRAAIFSSLYLPIVLTLASIGTALVLARGGLFVMNDTISYGTLIAFITYTIQFFEPIRELARIFAEFQSAHASAERVVTLLNTEPEIQDNERVRKVYGVGNNKGKWPKLKGDIVFENVSFHYVKEEPILKNFNLKVRAGETIALVGETGSGKSTIVNLICRFYEPKEGRILIDGVDYRDRPQGWLHKNLGYVLQSPHLFSGSIRENIQYGCLEASEMDMMRAAKIVNAHEFISRLEKGYDTEVGEGGNLLSTGQKQLISFARAVLANPRIFVLDEATSSIDTESEQMIQTAIQKVLEGRTSFIIAHRLSTIRSADKILVIKKGKVVEAGNHRELMGKRGHYYQLYTNQFIEEAGKKLLYK